ncbi:hypothetical protein [Actinobaculum sp. 352]|uniref:hypothetical protein n=1 Tax=Actinobaculum sp. 352 TaxID=2490946 RepID=UPI000F7D7C49|nr:hypothetical protein [Actinobaculum sp. 352]RTE48813.1 hypothetical protein EKN07_08900 [Actinobaculum sp. 352]
MTTEKPETHAEAAARLLAASRTTSATDSWRCLAAAGIHATLEIADIGRAIAQALILLNQPTNSPRYEARLAGLAATIGYPDPADPSGNLARLLDQQNNEARAQRHEHGDNA